MLVTGFKAPQFKLQDETGKERSLSDFQDKPLILYFYPKDDTPGCTKEACSIRDSYNQITQFAHVCGVSKDSVKSHQKFKKKYNLPFTLLSDPDMEVIKSYQAFGIKKMFGKEYQGTKRITYIISPQGNIIKSYAKVSPATHAQELITDIKSLAEVR